MTHNVVRVLGPVSRIRRGTERKDRIKLNEKELMGFVRVTKQNGTTTETTHYRNRWVEGYHWVWLAKRNSRTVKVENEVPVVEHIREMPKSKPATKPEPKLTRIEILEKVSKGEIKPKDAPALLKEAA